MASENVVTTSFIDERRFFNGDTTISGYYTDAKKKGGFLVRLPVQELRRKPAQRSLDKRKALFDSLQQSIS